MKKLRAVDWNIMDNNSLKREFTKEQIIEYADQLFSSYIGLLSEKMDSLGISLAMTGSINPKFFKTQLRNGAGDVGLKVWVSNE